MFSFFSLFHSAKMSLANPGTIGDRASVNEKTAEL